MAEEPDNVILRILRELRDDMKSQGRRLDNI